MAKVFADYTVEAGLGVVAECGKVHGSRDGVGGGACLVTSSARSTVPAVSEACSHIP